MPTKVWFIEEVHKLKIQNGNPTNFVLNIINTLLVLLPVSLGASVTQWPQLISPSKTSFNKKFSQIFITKCYSKFKISQNLNLKIYEITFA
jgi:hypothetical protein